MDLTATRAIHAILSLENRIALAALLIGFSLAVPAQAGDDMLPNPKLTPGKIARKDKDRRGVTEEMERNVFNRYRIPWRRRAEFKIDHLIPIELGRRGHHRQSLAAKSIQPDPTARSEKNY